MNAIHINPILTSEHDAALGAYWRGAVRLTPEQWHTLREAIDLLAKSIITLQERTYTFTQFYETFIERQFADAFLHALTTMPEVAREAPLSQAATARQIVHWFQQQDFYRQKLPGNRKLLIFCLYWWASFALGYAFEQEIFCDLRAAGIKFVGHDFTKRGERLWPFDLTVLGLRGDVKYSVWFLMTDKDSLRDLDFFITRLYEEATRRWQLVVLLRRSVWRLLNGRAQKAVLQEFTPTLPASLKMRVGELLVLFVMYDEWKSCILSLQDIGWR